MNEDDSNKFGEIAKRALTSVPLSPEQSTKASNGLAEENARKRAFLQTFKRWEVLFRRRDGDMEADRWLIAEYFRALGHLSQHALNTLTDMLIRQCTFFPSIAECLKLMECGRYDYSHPFHHIAHSVSDDDRDQIGTTAWRRAELGKHGEAAQIANKPNLRLLEGGEPTQ